MKSQPRELDTLVQVFFWKCRTTDIHSLPGVVKVYCIRQIEVPAAFITRTM
nr:hypothetical protein [Candidatus Sigynarchaeota archaeon]